VDLGSFVAAVRRRRDVKYRRRNEAPLEIAVFVSDNPCQILEQKLLIRVRIVILNCVTAQVSPRVVSAYSSLNIEASINSFSIFDLSRDDVEIQHLRAQTHARSEFLTNFTRSFNRRQELLRYRISIRLSRLKRDRLFVEICAKSKDIRVRAYRSVAISIPEILFSDAAVSSACSFAPFFFLE